MINIVITNNALNYLFLSLKNENEDDLVVYVSVIYPLTKYAHVNITFCKYSELNSDDLKLDIDFDGMVYIENKSISFLRDSVIDFNDNKLFVNAPNIYVSGQNVNIKEGVKQLFENEINVILSQHGGFIELVDIVDEKTIVIKFHGGCQGCGMVGYTMNNYIEKMIKKNFPQIENISDITSHEIKDKAYY